MNKQIVNIMNAVAVGLGALLVPLITLSGAGTWNFHFTILIIMVLVIAALNLRWQTPWLLGAAAVLAVVGSSANWTLLPLALAQLLLAFLATTQDTSTPLRATMLIAQAAFLQVLLTMTSTAILSKTFLLQLLFTTLPFIIAAWSSKLPLLVTVALVIIIVGAGYFTQTLTLLAALIAIIWALLPMRNAARIPAWYWACGLPVIGLILQLGMLHG